MGCVSNVGCQQYEMPVHTVSIPASFELGKHEVTFAEWDACVADGGCANYRPADEGWGRGNRPVINVSWEDAQVYVEWLSNKTGENYRLPTEAEWEYAARAGTQTAFSTGDCINTDQANYNGTFDWGSCGKTGVFREQTTEVESFPANQFGLYDMHGNVWEWVQDCYHNSYQDSVPKDGSAWEEANCMYRVLRGGSWENDPAGLRSAIRGGRSQTERVANSGFRVARDR